MKWHSLVDIVQMIKIDHWATGWTAGVGCAVAEAGATAAAGCFCAAPAAPEPSEMQTHCPSRFSFQSVILLSPPETASMLPDTDQLRCHTTSSKVLRTLGVHALEELTSELLQIITLRS